MMHDGQTLLRRSRRWWLWVGYWIGLFVMMHVPLPAPPEVPAGSDKGLHFALYLILTLLGGRYQLGKDARTRPGAFILWAVVFMVYAAIDEWLQPFVGRTADLIDWLADAAGVAVGTAVLMLARR